MSRSDALSHRPHRRISSLRLALPAAAIGAVLCLSMPAAAVSVAGAQIQDRDGNVVGNTLLRSTPAGALLHVKLAGLPRARTASTSTRRASANRPSTQPEAT
jgi:hypothetical protein